MGKIFDRNIGIIKIPNTNTELEIRTRHLSIKSAKMNNPNDSIKLAIVSHGKITLILKITFGKRPQKSFDILAKAGNSMGIFKTGIYRVGMEQNDNKPEKLIKK
ncbi:hypothetical protein F8M41_026272 [Gigaspora margarita]|uniref:Uncharacterized protein n=1 Tax=Gigaspora margarita TaxID=4874 RepID=A0A8H4AB88_GIGMA|nr:hypothetical protein F8M41_026272 [Gigaspora margarita]